MQRQVQSHYTDPLDAIWLHAASLLGLKVGRSPLGYATTDGKGTLTLAAKDDLDADDCLAQMIIHEICHYLVQGEASFHLPDWGLDNDVSGADYSGDTLREEACLRVQAALLRKYGLRRFLAPTTDFRSFYDSLPSDPLALSPKDPVLALCRAALSLAARMPFAKVLDDALLATSQIHALAQAAPGQLAGTPLPSIYSVSLSPKRHPLGFPLREEDLVPSLCGQCAWYVKGSFCRQRKSAGDRRKVNPGWPACVLFEESLSCIQCAACCRHAFDAVLVETRDPVRQRRPEYVEADGQVYRIRRDAKDNRCAALSEPEPGVYPCQIYDDRPRTCRDFTRSSDNCLMARRRVGWSL